MVSSWPKSTVVNRPRLQTVNRPEEARRKRRIHMGRFNRNSLVTRIVILFVIFNIVSLFIFTFYIWRQDQYRMSQNVEESIYEIASEKAKVISITMNNIANETEDLAKWTTEYIETTTDSALRPYYSKSRTGVLYRNKILSYGKNTSAIFFPANVPLTEEQIRIINATERLESFFSTMFNRVNYYQWSYIATSDGLLRIYPYSDIDMFEPNHQQNSDPFYVVANKENNPDRQAVWTKPYVDYMGTGWMVSCSSPLYQKDRFWGVACTDVRLDILKSNFLEDFRLSDSGFACLLDNEGNIIYHPNYLPVGNQQGQLFLSNIIKDASVPDKYKAVWKKILSDRDAGVVSYYDTADGNQKKLIAYAPIESQGWTLAVEVDYDDFMAVNKFEPSNLVIYILIVFIALLFFSMFLYRQYSKPIIMLRNEAWNIAAGQYNNFKSPSDLTEIKALSDAFNSMSRDIKEFTDDLIQKNKEIESIINSIGGLLMIISPEYDIILLNDKGKSVFKDKTTDAVGRKCYSVLLNRTSPCKGCKVHQVLTENAPAYTRMAIKEEIISNSYFPILNNAKELVEIVVHSQKITKRVLMEKELIQQEKLAGIGQISSAIAHELKTPLAVIKGASYLLKVYTKEQQDPRVADTLQSISSTVENAEKAIYNLLDYSGQGRDRPEQIDITKVINQILFLSNKERIQKNIETDMIFSHEPLLYYGQAEPIKIVLQNIISNAIKALPEGGLLKIEGHYIRKGSVLEISITDNGIGIPKSLRSNLFKPFFTTDKTGKGTGLGLWITKMMVEKMKGEIFLQTKEGEGTKFTLHLPVTNMRGEISYES